MRVGVYVDAFNVYYGGRSLCGRYTAGWRWLDVGGLAMGPVNSRLWPDAVLARLVYCTAYRNREGDPSSLTDQKNYIAALQHHRPLTMVMTGRYAPRTKTGILLDLRGGRSASNVTWCQRYSVMVASEGGAGSEWGS